MLLHEVKKILNAELLCGEELMGKEVHCACASDFMSDVLAFVKEQDLLLTGMVNPQVIRTAEMMDISCIVFVRGKIPDETVVNMARERGIAVMTTQRHMFAASGMLYSEGLVGKAGDE